MLSGLQLSAEYRFAKHGNFYVSSVRTTRFGLKGLKIEGAKLWKNIPNNIKDILYERNKLNIDNTFMTFITFFV